MSAKNLATFSLVLIGLCVIVAGCVSDSVSPSGGEAPMLPPQNLTAYKTSGDWVILMWDPNTQGHLLGYNVYRMEVGGGTIEKLTQTPITANRYDDYPAGWNKSYEYRVTSVSVKGAESSFTSYSVTVNKPPFNERRGRGD